MMKSVTDLQSRAIEILATLIRFDTTSRKSNLELVEYVDAFLRDQGITARRIADATGSKANLLATIGPEAAGGVVLSGHTDVVPVTGQDWQSDPFTLTERNGRLYGRGTCDMKGFLALALAAAPLFANGRRPVHLAFTYDEEVGCLGAPDLIRTIAADVPKPRAVIVGEPTGMAIVNGHKGIAAYRVTVTGHEAHSSLTHLGISANMVAIRLLALLADLSASLAAAPDPHSPFIPAHATLTVGQINGGTAFNILARECIFCFDLRVVERQDAEIVLAEFFSLAEQLDRSLAEAYPGAGVKIERFANTPPLPIRADGDAESFVRALMGDNRPARAVSYAAEAGQFHQAGFSSVLCGPGSIEQAHQPNEYIEVEQMTRGAEFMLRLADMLRKDR